MTEHAENSLHEVPGSDVKLTDQELTAYNTAMQAIDGDLSIMRPVREALSRLERVQWTNSEPKSFDTITTPEGNWQAHGLLLKLLRCEVFLCRNANGDQWAVIQKLQASSPYAQAHGATDILVKGIDASIVAREYMAQMRHTLRFMARNAEVKAQKIVWEQFPDDHPAKVIHAISERCDSVAEGREVIKQERTQSVRQSRGIGI